MRVFAISDLHLSISTEKPMDIFGPNWKNHVPKIQKYWKENINEEDVVLIAGDLSWAMKIEQFQQDLIFFDDLPGKKVILKGNHDFWWKSISAVRQILPENMFALQHDSIKFENIVICGTRGWDLPCKESTEEDKKIFNREVLRLELALKNATSKRQEGDKLILMMHYPPYSKTNKSNDLINLIKQYNVEIVIFGHIHTEYILPLYTKIDNCEFFMTSCDMIKNKPILLQFD